MACYETFNYVHAIHPRVTRLYFMPSPYLGNEWMEDVKPYPSLTLTTAFNPGAWSVALTYCLTSQED